MIGIIPAGGRATRILGLPKMLLPVGHSTLFQLLTERMEYCTPRAVYVAPSVTTVGLLLPYFAPNMLAYGTRTRTMAEDVLIGRRYAGDDPVLFGMSDTYFDDDMAFVRLSAALRLGADVAVGVFYTRPEQRASLGMCRLDDDRVTEVIDKAETDLVWAWGVLAWKPAFWDCIHADDPHVGYGLPRAIARGLDVRAVRLPGGYWDCGTAEQYFALVKHLAGAQDVAV